MSNLGHQINMKHWLRMSYKGIGEAEDYDSNFGDTQELNDR